nr:hypothetical protein [Campylobacter rectus]
MRPTKSKFTRVKATANAASDAPPSPKNSALLPSLKYAQKLKQPKISKNAAAK